MKYVLLSLPVILLIYLFFFYSKNEINNKPEKGIVFQEIKFEEALAKAKAEKKLIFVDVFATWCGPCKQLKKSTFKDEKVGAYFNSKYINLAIDAEKGEGEMLASKFNIQGYPTLLILDENGTVLKQHIGFIQANELLQFAK